MNTTTEICTCLIKNATQLLQDEEGKRSSELHPYMEFLVIGMQFGLIVSFLAFMIFINPKHRAKLPNKITRTPTIPFAVGNFVELNVDKDARILINPTEKYGNWCTKKLNAIMKMLFGIDYTVQSNARMISIRMKGFKPGKRFHDFEPIDGAAPGSFYTYQMYGDNTIQVTRYVERGVSYIAGFCIYIPDRFCFSVDYNKDLVESFWNSEKYPGRIDREDDWDEPVAIEIQKNVEAKFCLRRQEYMISWEEAGGVMHREWNQHRKEIEEKVCGVCTELQSDPLI